MKEKCLSIILICCLILCACGNKEAKYQEKYDLGVKYLSEGNYEEAIIAFEAAIKIDAKQAPAYVGRGDSCMRMAEQTGDAAQKEAYYSQAVADYQKAIDLGDETIVDKLQCAQLLMSSQDFLQTLYTSFAADDLDKIQELMNQEDYKQLAESVDEGYLYYSDGSENGLAIYPNYYCYFGQWKDEQRSGEGSWVCTTFQYDFTMRYAYNGAWLNDRPNGTGLVQIVTQTFTQEDKGDFVGGKAEGTVKTKQYYYIGNIWEKEREYVNGIANGVEHAVADVKGAIYESWTTFDKGYPYGTVRTKAKDRENGMFDYEYERDVAEVYEDLDHRRICYVWGLDIEDIE